MRFFDIEAGEPFDGNARASCLLTLFADGLALARGQRCQEIVKTAVATIVPVILRIGALEQA